MKSENFIIKTARVTDAEVISKIEKECFSLPWSEQAITDFISFPSNIFLCAFSNDTLCGYISATVVLDEMQIANVAVSKSYRRLGLASMLIEGVLSICQDNKLSILTLEVRKSNTPAIELYKKFGFSIEGSRRNYYTNPVEDAYIMNKHLKQPKEM